MDAEVFWEWAVCITKIDSTVDSTVNIPHPLKWK